LREARPHADLPPIDRGQTAPGAGIDRGLNIDFARKPVPGLVGEPVR
jgi:hypothetical protein